RCLLPPPSLSRRPPPSQPLPYTTLFRSWRGNVPSDPITSTRTTCRFGTQGQDLHFIVARTFVYNDINGTRTYSRSRSIAGNRVQDRKSTRLNSSHVKSSYAVFCSKTQND